MMTFEEHLAKGADLEEGIVRTGAITANAARSRRFGDEAVESVETFAEIAHKVGELDFFNISQE